MRFIVGKLSKEELDLISRGYPVISKLLLIPDDYRLFHYKEGDEIEAETQDGNRIWTTIRNMEIVQDDTSIVVILTLVRSEQHPSPHGHS